ncbi:hypothetical protein N566_05965 [Streptomycetaceae bacterium MP113-05]|nr:hypothetical protein N566_05965 [Streptomycetaceae bacterium MP113-05]
MTVPRAARRVARPAARPAVAVLLLAALTTGCGLGAELEREANPARTPGPGATTTVPGPGPSTAPSLAPPPQALPTACPESGLRATTGFVSAAMGQRATSVTLTNCGDTPQKLNGYPSLTVLDEDHRPLDVEVLQGTKGITAGLSGPKKPVPVTLAPGEAAETGIAWRNTVTLSVAPAPGEPAQVVEIDGGLDLGNTGRLGTTPWHRTER